MDMYLMNKEMLKNLCAKSIGMTLGDNLNRDSYLVALLK